MKTKTQDHDEDQGLCRYKPRPIAAGTALSVTFVVKQKKLRKFVARKSFFHPTIVAFFIFFLVVSQSSLAAKNYHGTARIIKFN
jgi:hypothetical protein